MRNRLKISFHEMCVFKLGDRGVTSTSPTPFTEAPAYLALQREMHVALRVQHPEWGSVPMATARPATITIVVSPTCSAFPRDATRAPPLADLYDATFKLIRLAITNASLLALVFFGGANLHDRLCCSVQTIASYQFSPAAGRPASRRRQDNGVTPLARTGPQVPDR